MTLRTETESPSILLKCVVMELSEPTHKKKRLSLSLIKPVVDTDKENQPCTSLEEVQNSGCKFNDEAVSNEPPTKIRRLSLSCKKTPCEPLIEHNQHHTSPDPQ